MDEGKSTRSGIIKTIGTPLGFFVLALLIVEAFLATVLIGANLDTNQKTTGMWLGVSLFVLVTVAVFLLVWFKPENLMYDKEAHLIKSGKIPFGSDSEKISPAQRFTDKETEK